MVYQKTRFQVFQRDKFTCQYCGRSSPEVVLEVDHVTPVSKGGTNNFDNLITSCRECNRGKSNNRLFSDIPIPNQAKLDLLRGEHTEIFLRTCDIALELKQLYLRKTELEIQMIQYEIDTNQYNINTITEDKLIKDPAYKGESLEEYIIDRYKSIGIFENIIRDLKSKTEEVMTVKLKELNS